MNNHSGNKFISSVLAVILVLQLLLGGVFTPQPVYAFGDKPQGLEVPENIRVEATDTTIRISWDEVEKANGYEIQLGDETIENIESTDYLIEDLTPDTEYSLRVRAVDKKSNSGWSGDIKVRTSVEKSAGEKGASEEGMPDEDTSDENTSEIIVPDEEVPDVETPLEDEVSDGNIESPDEGDSGLKHDEWYLAPENIEAECTDKTISLSWDSVKGAKHYEANINGKTKENIDETEYIFEDLKPDTEYRIKIRAVGEKSKSEWSETIEVTTLKEQMEIKVPQVPGDLSAEVTESDITLSWDAAKDAECYDVEVNSSIMDNVTVTEYVYGGIEPDKEYVFRVRSVNSSAKSEWCEELRVQTPKVQPIGTGNGLLGEYYDNIDFKDLVLTRIDPEIDFDWGLKAPDPDMDGIGFSARWTGQVQPRYSGKYTFYTYASNGVRLWVDGKLLIDEWKLLFPKESKGTIELTAGEKYDIRMEYQDALGDAEVKLLWASKEQKKQVIPQEQLYCQPKAPEEITAVPYITSVVLKWNEVAGEESYDIDINGETIKGVTGSEYSFENLTPDTEYTFKIRSVSDYGTSEWSDAITVSTLKEQDSVTGNGNGLTGKYYDNIIFTKLILERTDKTIDFDWGRNAPDPKIKGNTFSVKWEGQLLPKYTAKHTIYLYSDDGAKLWINGEELIDFWKPHSSKEGSATIDLVAGEKYDIRIEYFNINKEAKVALYWSNPYEEKQIIPMEQLYTIPGVTGGLEAFAEGSSITVTWDNTPGADSYELEVDGASVNVGLEAEYEHKGLEPNTQHNYRVRAVNELGKGEWSELITKTSAPGIPPNVTMEATDTAITVSWGAVEAADTYEIETDGEIIENGSNTSYTHSGLKPNSEHNYRIRSLNSNGKGEWSKLYSRYTLPDTPKSFETAVTSNTITISWNSVPGALAYEIEADGVVNSTGLETTYTHRGLRPNTEHVYRVRAIGHGGTGYWSTEVIASTMLAVPQNFAAKATSSSIALTWDQVVDAQYYDLEIDGNVIDNGGSTEYTHSGLAPNVEHIYRVRAREDLGAGDWSEPLKIKTLLDTPVNLRAEATDKSITIAWDAVTDAASYDVELSGIKTVNVSEPTCVIYGLDSSTEYTYRVMARCEGNVSEWSSKSSIITLPDVPSNIEIVSSSTTNTVTWNSVRGATSYEIEADGQLLDNGTLTVFNHESLEPDSAHTYKVRAIGPGGTGYWSELMTKTTAPHVPVNVQMASTSTVTTINWDIVTEADSYEIEVDGRVIDNGASNGYIHSGIEPNSAHSYRIRAINENGIGDWTEVLTKTTAPHIPSDIVFESSSTITEVRWDALSEAGKYEIEVDGTVLDNGMTTSYAHSGLEANTQHKYRVRAINSNGIGDWSELLFKTTAPHIPVNLSAVSTSETNTLSWDRVEEAEGYEVEADGEIINAADTSFVHTDIEPDSEHGYRIRAVNSNGKGDWSGLLSKTTAPHVPGNITPVSSSTKINYTWEAVHEAQYYEIEIDNVLLTDMTGTSYVYSGLAPDSEHLFRIRAVNGNGIGDWSELIHKYTAPGVPVNLSAVSTSDSITITWDAVEAASGYDVEVNGTAVDAGSGTTYAHTGLNPNTQRAYKVRAKNENGIGDWSRVVVRTTLPGVPSSITAEAAETSIALSWDSVAGADQYDIMVNSAIVESTTVTEYVYGGLTPNTEYSFNIRAKNEDGAGNWSETITKTTMFGAPQGLAAVAAETSITLTWQPLPEGTVYDLEADGIIVYSGVDASFIHQDLISNTQHTYRVRAKNEASASIWSEEISAITLPLVPSSLKVTAGSNGANVTWAMVEGALGYELEADGNIIEVGLANTYQHLNLTHNTTHVYRVRTVAEGGRSAWSNEITAVTLLGVPQNIAALVTNTSAVLTWDAVEGATSYEVEADGIVLQVIDGTSYTHAGLKSNSVHVYRVRAKSGEYPGEWSTTVTALTMLNIPSNIKTLSTANTITITWEAAAGAESYEVETNGIAVSDIKDTVYQLSGLTPNTKHVIRVKAESTVNTSDWSAEVTQFTTPEIPQNFMASSTVDSTKMVWDAVYGASGYDIEIDGTVIDTGLQTTYTNAGLVPNTQHIYRVRAKNVNLAGEWSMPLTETTVPEMTISCAADESFNFVVVAPKKEGADHRTITVTFNADELELLDIYAATAGADLKEGRIEGTDVTVTQLLPGKIVLTLDTVDKTVMNIIKFKAKTNQNSSISYEIE